MQSWGQTKVIPMWPNPQWGTEQQRLINAHNYSWFRFEEGVSSTSFSWSTRWHPLLTKHILHLHLSFTSSANHDFFVFQNLGILRVTTPQLLCTLEMVHSNWLQNRLQPREFRDALVNGLAALKAGLQWSHPSRLLTAKQKAPYNYCSCYISFSRDSFRCKFIYRGRWDEMCNRHTWLTRILYL